MKQSKITVGKSGNLKCPFEVRWLADGKRIRKRFQTRADAEMFADEMRAEEILPDAYRFAPDERTVFASIKTLCARAEIALSDAVEIIRASIAAKQVAGYTWTDAQAAFLADCERRGARSQTVRFYRTQLRMFAERERVENVAEITPARAEKYLAGILSPEHAKRALRAFFNFCARQKWIADNPFELAKTPRKLAEVSAPEILSVGGTRRLLDNILAEWTPAVALMAFAGIRPFEIISLDGSPVLRVADIDFPARKITIRPEVSKVRRRRILTDLPDNLWAWIEPLRDLPPSDNVVPASVHVWRRVKRKCGVALGKDVLRHSFASYAYHYIGAERAVEILGHVGGFGVFAKHYKGLATAAEAAQYFSILPPEKA